jgi:translation initiation factor 2 subunit 1
MGLDEIKRGEFLICKIEKIHPYGVTVFLEEYPGVQGFVPLAQIANRWIKNIRNFVRVGQIKVGIVLSVNTDRGQVDISFSRVNTTEERKKMVAWRETKRAIQLLNLLSKETKIDSEKLWDEIVPKVLEKYDSVTDAFKEIILGGQDAVKEIPEKYRGALYGVLSKNMAVTKKEVIESVDLKLTSGQGLIEIKELFKNIPKVKDVEEHISYLGGGKYQIKFTASNYKKIEKLLKDVNDHLVNKVGKKGTIQIKRRE